jgi:hypothetical protein
VIAKISTHLQGNQYGRLFHDTNVVSSLVWYNYKQFSSYWRSRKLLVKIATYIFCYWV